MKPKPAPAAKLDAKPEVAADAPPRRWFGLVPPKCDRSQAGFIKAIRAAMAELGDVDFVSTEAVCDAIEEHIRKQLNAPRDSIRVWWVGTRRSNKHSRIVITTDWALREDFEHTLSFQLFKK